MSSSRENPALPVIMNLLDQALRPPTKSSPFDPKLARRVATLSDPVKKTIQGLVDTFYNDPRSDLAQRSPREFATMARGQRLDPSRVKASFAAFSDRTAAKPAHMAPLSRDDYGRFLHVAGRHLRDRPELRNKNIVDVFRAAIYGLANLPRDVSAETLAKLDPNFKIIDPDLVAAPYVGSVAPDGQPSVTPGGGIKIDGYMFSPDASKNAILLHQKSGQGLDLAPFPATAANKSGKKLQAVLPTTVKPGKYDLVVRVDGNKALTSNAVPLLVATPPPPAPQIDPTNQQVFPGRNLLITGSHLKGQGIPFLLLEPVDGPGPKIIVVADLDKFNDTDVTFPIPVDTPVGKYKATFNAQLFGSDVLSNPIQIEVVSYHWRVSFLDLSWQVFGLGGWADSGLFTSGMFPGLVSPYPASTGSAPLAWCRWNIFAVYTVIVDKEGFTVTTKNHLLDPIGTPTGLGNEGIVVADPGVTLTRKVIYDVHLYAYDPGSTGTQVQEAHKTVGEISEIGTIAATVIGTIFEAPEAGIAFKHVMDFVDEYLVPALVKNKNIPASTTLVSTAQGAPDWKPLQANESAGTLTIKKDVNTPPIPEAWTGELVYHLKTTFKLDRVEPSV